MDIAKRAKELSADMVSLRRELHACPEVDHDLPLTESVVVRELAKLGLDEIKSNQGKKHGVFATLKGSRAGNVLAIRADMDALPVKEETGLPFASQNGFMHACGHDAHVAMLLSAARILSEQREDLPGTVRFIFQPAEETIYGAVSLIESGALDHPKVDEIIALHTGNIWRGVAPGRIGYRAGAMMAATNVFKITLRGRGGHGAMPHLTVDPIVMAAEVISQLQTLVSREINPFDPAVLTIGKIEGGTANNVIAESCEFTGMLRTFDIKVAAFLEERVMATAKGVAEAMRGSADVEFVSSLPPVVNDKAITLKMRDIVNDVLGEGYAQELEFPSSGAEDFARYLQKIPGALFFHSAVLDGERDHPHHNPRFDIDESVLWTGAAALSAYALRR
ncbi:N-acyl-L-amino acid amidohydrolase [Synergistales bacterium]|nr:N-acyl-L-amino acid amidohydrolase [Synergistales bacterium]